MEMHEYEIIFEGFHAFINGLAMCANPYWNAMRADKIDVRKAELWAKGWQQGNDQTPSTAGIAR